MTQRTKRKLSPTFNISEKPAHAGVYEWEDWLGWGWYRMWTGKYWLAGARTPKYASMQTVRYIPRAGFDIGWRGIIH